MHRGLLVPAALMASCSGAAVNMQRPGISPRVDPVEDKQTFCYGHSGSGWDLRTEEGSYEAWSDTGAFLVVDMFIRDNGPVYWPEAFEKEANVQEASSATGGCATLHGTCGGGSEKSCEEYFDDSGNDPWAKNGYWIFKAITGLHAKLSSMHSALVAEGLLADLGIGQLIEDLGGSPSEDSTFPDIAGWLASAVGLGGTLTGEANFKGKTAVSTGLGIFSSIISMVAKAGPQTEEGVKAAGIESSLQAVLEQALENIETTLSLAMGNVKDEAAYEKLPVPPGGQEMDTPIGNFFRNGWALIYEDSDPVQEVRATMISSIRAKVVDQILQEVGYVLVGMEQDKVEGGCSGGSGSGEYLLKTNSGAEYCFYIAKPNKPNNVEYMSKADPEIFNAMAGAGIESHYAYYQQILKCQRPMGGEADDYQPNGEGLEVGEVAPCLFNMPTAIVAETDICDFYVGESGQTPCTDYELKDIE